MSGTYDGYLRNLRAVPARSAIWRNASLQESCFIVIPPGARSPTFGLPGVFVTLTAAPSSGSLEAATRLKYYTTRFARPENI